MANESTPLKVIRYKKYELTHTHSKSNLKMQHKYRILRKKRLYILKYNVKVNFLGDFNEREKSS